MKNIIILLATIFLLGSCSSIYFEEPQPKGGTDLTEIPDDLIGEYNFLVLNAEKNIKITKEAVFGDDTTVLSDDMILRKIDDYYVFNKKVIGKEDVINGKWEIYLLKKNDCGNIKAIMFSILADDDNPNIVFYFVAKYKPEIIRVDGAMGKSDSYIINPSNQEFLDLIKNRGATVGIILENVKNQ